MSKKLTTLEEAALRLIASAPANKGLAVEEHISFLSVVSREKTGAGMYVNFEDTCPIEIQGDDVADTGVLSTNHIIELDSLTNGLGFALYTSRGRFSFLEFFTYGEAWDGTYHTFSFLEI